jgi:hypothetical protein
MNKRILKRHQRRVSRAREQIRLSQREQVGAAREVSRSVASRHSLPHVHYATPWIQNSAGCSGEGAPKAEEK